MGDVSRIEGTSELKHFMEELPKRVRTKALRRGINAASSPIVKEAKANTPRESGLLKKAITKKLKQYQGGDVVTSIIGVNTQTVGDYDGKKRWPIKYLHLVEGGTAHSPAHHMLKNAYDSQKDEASEIALDKMQTVLEEEAEKLANR